MSAFVSTHQKAQVSEEGWEVVQWLAEVTVEEVEVSQGDGKMVERLIEVFSESQMFEGGGKAVYWLVEVLTKSEVSEG